MSKNVVITGLGFISSIGNSKEEVLDSLKNLKCGIETNPELQTELKSPVFVSGTIKGFETSSLDPEDWTIDKKYSIKREVLRSMSPNVLYAHCAFTQAVEDAGLSPEEISNPDTGIYTASAGSVGQTHRLWTKLEKSGVMRCSPLGIVSSVVGTLSFNLVASWKIKGASCGFATACASSGHALALATEEIKQGRQKRMFVVGAEDCDKYTILPFAGMRALSTSQDPLTASRPFDKKRNGFVGSGGGTVLVIEDEEEAIKRGAKIYCKIKSWGQASDGYNVAISHPEGEGLVRAMNTAIENAGIKPDDIDYINAHATSTPIGDLSEIKAIKTVFGSLEKQPYVSSTKALSGHTVSMAGAFEAGIVALCMQNDLTPASANITELEPSAAEINVLQENLNVSPKIAMTNSSGFGGANVSIILEKV